MTLASLTALVLFALADGVVQVAAAVYSRAEAGKYGKGVHARGDLEVRE